MDLSREALQTLATQLGVRADVLERVVRLLKVLGRFRADEDLSGAIALKGGTALNVFWLPLPRFSVDIDVNFVGSVSAGELAVLRPAFEQRVARACQLAGCRVVHRPTQHAGGKFRLRFESLLMGEQNLELDISYVARVPVFDLVERHAMLGGFENELVMTHTLAELAAGKFTALLTRSVARDRYDAARILAAVPGMLERPEFRLAFTCFSASAREDARSWEGSLGHMDANEVRNALVPLLRVTDRELTHDARLIADTLDRELGGVGRRLVAWSRAEAAFLDALLGHGELQPELLASDEGIRDRIARQPMLRWKQRNVRQHLGLPPVRADVE